MTIHAAPKHIAIIGGGIAGLSAAWAIQQSGAATYTLLEADDRWGGKIATERVYGWGDAPFIVECGPDALLTRKPWAWTLAQELGLGNAILPVNTATRGTYVLWDDQLLPLPEGMPLLVPTKLGPFLRSRLFSPAGKLRILMEPFIPARREAGDESVGAFVRRRLGREALERLADPLLGGIYNADVDHQSLWATFPQFGKLEETHGSLLRGSRAKRADAKASSLPAFFSFPEGMQTLVDELVPRLTGDLRLNSAVSKIDATSERYRLTLESGAVVDADAVILATPAPIAGRLLSAVAPVAAHQLAAMRSTSIGTISLGYRRADVPHPMDGHGVVVPKLAHRRIDGISWSSSKWAGRAPEGYALLRVFFGGAHSSATMALDDAEIVNVVREELNDVMGISAAPVFHHIQRWQDAYPEYAVGHLDSLGQIEKQLPSNILLAGSAYRGIGVPDCIAQGQSAAAKAIARHERIITE